MEDQSKTKQVLIQELDSLRQRIAELEQSELEHRQAEGASRDNETKLQAIFNTVGTGILIIDRDTQIIIEANQTAIEMTGLPKERIIGKICHSLVCSAQAGKCPVKDLGQSVDHSERKLIHADGHLKDILETVYPITIKGRDCYIESFIDITDRKRAEEALRESEEKFRVLADSTPTAVMLYQDDRWVYANRAAETICGYSEKELLAMNFWDILHPDFKPLIQERGRKRQRGEETTNRYEFKIIMKDGAEKWVDLSGASTMLRGRPAGIISVLDITDRVLIQEEREKLQSRLIQAQKMEAIGTLARHCP
ncbi:MAG: PAS domain S-box protein [Deltaproteobacteria bacterium]|nr:PAS domain S-box protein [Deltaproteobacteria bacterium]